MTIPTTPDTGTAPQGPSFSASSDDTSQKTANKAHPRETNDTGTSHVHAVREVPHPSGGRPVSKVEMFSKIFSGHITRRWAVAILGVLMLGMMVHAIFLNCVAEDAFISFRFARHVAKGEGFVWNIGEPPVEGFTNFLWVVLFAIIIKLGFNPEIPSQVAGVLATAATMIYVYRTSRLLHGSALVRENASPIESSDEETSSIEYNASSARPDSVDCRASSSGSTSLGSRTSSSTNTSPGCRASSTSRASSDSCISSTRPDSSAYPPSPLTPATSTRTISSTVPAFSAEVVLAATRTASANLEPASPVPTAPALRNGPPSAFDFLAVALMAASGATATWASSGMETSTFTLFVTLGLFYYLKGLRRGTLGVGSSFFLLLAAQKT